MLIGRVAFRTQFVQNGPFATVMIRKAAMGEFLKTRGPFGEAIGDI